MTVENNHASDQSLRTVIESVADQLCPAVDGKFDFRVKIDNPDPSIAKLQMLINFVIDAARRAIYDQQVLNGELKVAMHQIEASCKIAEEANRAKSEFLANMSHELRTPLTAIIGFTDILLEDADRSHKEKLSIIHRNGEHLLAVINDVLDLSKVEAGRLQTVDERVDLIELLDDVTSTVQFKIQQNGLTLARELITPIPAFVYSDALRLRQILCNLIGNAVKFTQKGGIRLELSYSKPPADQLFIDVVDTGIGIPEEALGKLFRPFAQADTSSSRVYGGTGLGLVISRKFANLLGGDVDIAESKLGEGTRVRFTFAANAGPNPEMIEKLTNQKNATKSETVVNSISTNSLSDLNILLVEDGIDNRRLISHILEKKGANITMAENGKIAIDLITSGRKLGASFDLILMDMQMPIMDGYQASTQLRKMDVDTPIIALTAHAMPGDRKKCIDAGCNDYTTKPINPAQLEQLIIKLTAEKSKFAETLTR